MSRTLLLPLLAAAGCGAEATSATPAPPPIPEPPETADAPAEPEMELDRRFEGVLLSAAADYRDWGRVDERPNLAPTLCRAPMWPDDYGAAARARLSKPGSSPHGRKIYFLYAYERSPYLSLGGTEAPPPVGTTIVKESWTTVPGRPEPTPPDAGARLSGWQLPPVTWVETDGGPLRADRQAELFIMTKLPPETPGTDAGWVYGTVTADGQTVTSAGRVRRCMRCHDDAPHERLFGLQESTTLAPLPPRPLQGGYIERWPKAGVD